MIINEIARIFKAKPIRRNNYLADNYFSAIWCMMHMHGNILINHKIIIQDILSQC